MYIQCEGSSLGFHVGTDIRSMIEVYSRFPYGGKTKIPRLPKASFISFFEDRVLYYDTMS